MKLALVSVLLVLGVGTAACGGDDTSTASDSSASSSPSAEASGGASAGASADASAGATTGAETSPLCTVLVSTTELATGAEISAFATALTDAGSPDSLTADQSKGLELYIGALEAVDPAATAEEVAAISDLGFTTAQETKVEDFFTYATSSCSPSGSASGAATPEPSTSTDTGQ